MWTWLNSEGAGSMVFSWVKVFAATILVLFLAQGADIFSVTASDAKLWLAAGFAAVVPLVVNYLNPRDTRYGTKEDEYV